MRHVYRILIVIVGTAYSCFAFGQEMSYSQFDSLSYQLYLQGEWNELIELGESPEGKEMDYFFQNYRMGVAWFSNGNYDRSAYWFQKAISKNSDSFYAREYLFWSLLYDQREQEAARHFKQLPDSIQGRIPYKPAKTIESVWFTVGRKSNNTSLIGSNTYLNLGMSHKFSPMVTLNWQFGQVLQPDNYWGGFSEQQYLLFPRINLQKGWFIELAGGVNHYKSTLDYSYSESWNEQLYPSTPMGVPPVVLDRNHHGDYIVNGTFDQQEIYSSVGFGRKKSGFKWSLYGSLLLNNEMPDFQVYENDSVIQTGPIPGTGTDTTITMILNDTSISDQTNRKSYVQFGLNLDWFPVSQTKHWSVGTGIHTVFSSDSTYFVVNPRVGYRFNSTWSTQLSFMRKKSHPLTLANGQVMLNYDARINRRIILTLNYTPGKNTTLQTTLLHENVTGDLDHINYNQNGVYVRLIKTF